MIGITLLCASLTIPQSTPVQANLAPNKASSIKLAHSARVACSFDNDPLLKAKTTVRSLENPYTTLWEGFARKAKVVIQRAESARELDTNSLGVYCTAVTVHDLMDAMAANVLGRWEAIPKGYRFLTSATEMDMVFMPKSERSRERNRKGMEFMGQTKSLPQEVQKCLEAGQPVSFNALPPEMQTLGKEMLHTIIEEQLAKLPPGTHLGLESDDYSQAVLKIGRESVKGFDSYYISLERRGAGSATWNVNNYEQRRAEGMQPGTTVGQGKLFVPEKHELSRDDAKERPLLKKMVSLQMRNTTLPQVLRKLNLEYNLNFVCDPISAFPQLATIDFKGITLGEALDRLTELYPKTEWELRKSNILVYRSATNPANDPDKGHDEAISTTIEK